jgi:hypothetical protein
LLIVNSLSVENPPVNRIWVSIMRFETSILKDEKGKGGRREGGGNGG